MVSTFVVGVCDGLDACEISRPEIMSQSAPVYIYLICIYLYFYVLLLVFSVICMHQGSESNAISILYMYVRYMWQN